LVLPDFARSAAGAKNINIQLKFDKLKQPDFYNLNKGSKTHYSSDGFFHNCSFFKDSNQLFEDLFIEHVFPREGQRLWFISHILFELVLDRILIGQHREKLDDFYASLKRVDLQIVIDFLAESGKDGTDKFTKFWEGFLKAQYLQYYLVDDKLVYSLNRVLLKAKQPELTEEQATVLIKIVRIAEKEIATQIPSFHKEFLAFKGNL
jgi:hypothetical protein